MSRYLYKKIQNISPESLNFQHSGLKLTTLGSDPNVVNLSEYSCAVTPQVRQTGNRLSGLAGTAYASLLT